MSWSLGNDFDCETCGMTWNEATFYHDWHDPNQWEFSYRVGCYGGDSVSYNSENKEDKLNEMFKHLREYPGWARRLDLIVRDMIEECDLARKNNE